MQYFLLAQSHSFEFLADVVTVSVQHSQIQRSKVVIEILEHKFIVDAEVMRVRRAVGFHAGLQRDEVQSIYKEETKI